MKLLLALALAAVASAHPQPAANPLSDAFIASINSRNSTWRAGRNFRADHSLDGLFGAWKNPNKTLPVLVHDVAGRGVFPDFFDARVQWGGRCKSIGEIRDQASCGSCWAFGAVEAMSDRICIRSNGEKQVSVSAEDLMSCCGLSCGLGCYGGFPDSAWYYWAQNGIVTGGEYGTNDGCKPYSLAPCAHTAINYSDKPACGDEILTPMCVSKCDTPSLSYKDELTFGEIVYTLNQEHGQVQMEIMTNGPVEAAFDVYEDFLSYKSGVYQHVEGKYLGGHAIKILGWGVENDTPYWLAANSWGQDWGEKGFFKILRGFNHVGIESEVVAGLPKL